MKLLIVGDQHFRLELPYSAALENGRGDEWGSTLKFVHDASIGCDAVVLMGDNLNARHNNSTVIKQFIEFLDGFGDTTVFIIAGNHERYGTHTAIDFLKQIKIDSLRGLNVFTEIASVDFGNKKLTFVPFMTPGLLDTVSIEDATKKLIEKVGSGDVVFLHHALSGAKTTSGGTTNVFNEIVVPVAEIEKGYNAVFAGHVHEPGVIKNGKKKVVMTGSLFSSSVGEHEKYLWKYDTDSGELEQIKIDTVRGIYSVEYKNEKSLEKIPDHSIVKCTVTKKNIDIEEVKKKLARFDASIVIEQYPDDRKKMHISDGTIDMTMENLLKMFAESRGLDYDLIINAYHDIK